MSHVVICPSCSAKLKSGNPVPAGRAINCPQCKHKFTTTVPSQEFSDGDVAPVVKRPPVPSGPPPIPGSSSGSKKVNKVDADEEILDADVVDEADIVDEPEVVEEEEVKPSKKKKIAKSEDEEDRPRSKKKSRRDEDDEDEEDRPRSKKKSRRDEDDEDEEDRPRSKKKSRADTGEEAFEEEDEDELPRGKKSRKKKKSKLPVLLLAIGIPVLLLLLGGVGYLVLSMFSGGASSELMAWAPSASEDISGMNVAKLTANSKIKKSLLPNVTRIEAIGLPVDEIDELMLARSNGAETLVVRAKSKLDVDKLVKTSGAKEENADGKKFYNSPMGSFHVPSSKLLVFCSNTNTLSTLLKKENKVTISSEMKSLVAKASGDIWAAKKSLNPMAEMGFGMAGPRAQFSSCTVSSSSLKVSVTMIFVDENVAKQTETKMQTLAKDAKPKGAESIEVSRSGDSVTINISGNLDNEATIFLGRL